jgi:hypothetical protein
MSDSKPFNLSTAVLWIGLILGVALVIAGILLINTSGEVYATSLKSTPAFGTIKEGYAGALLYFTLALGVLLLGLLFPRLQNISFGGISLTLRDLPAKMDNIARQVNALQSGSAGPGGSRMAALASKEIPPDQAKTRTKNWEDVRTGEQGQLHIIAGPLSANGSCRVTATVQASGKRPPLEGLVQFHLAEDFANPNPVILAIDGKAELQLERVLGPFILSAEVRGEKLSIDLQGAYA